MAVGEYISVSSQRDSEAADVETERRQQAAGPTARKRELVRARQPHRTGDQGLGVGSRLRASPRARRAGVCLRPRLRLSTGAQPGKACGAGGSGCATGLCAIVL